MEQVTAKKLLWFPVDGDASQPLSQFPLQSLQPSRPLFKCDCLSRSVRTEDKQGQPAITIPMAVTVLHFVMLTTVASPACLHPHVFLPSSRV
ncbi:hypothetical protein J6590_103568 [Homalodisca vitripennis]|nr:hypothetical protein J6590_103568 [Homalodisca vitripennis]